MSTIAALAVLSTLVLLVASACGGGGRGGSGSTNPGSDFSGLRGNITIDGSSTVYPITQAMAEEFGKASDVRVSVGFSGSGGGFEKFCRGETQVSDASRPIKDSEKQACAQNGINDIVELKVGIDALTVVVNSKNTWATCMTTEQLTMAFKNGGAKTWKDVNPGWPDEPIKFYYPGTDSGTFDYFVEAIIGREKGATHRADGTSSEDDNVLVRGVEGDKDAIGYFGFAYFEEAGKQLRAVQVDNGNGCVAPTFDNALQGKYAPLSRPLFIYTRESFLRERPEILGFVQFYFENLDAIVKEVGYITLPEEDRAAQEAKFAAAAH